MQALLQLNHILFLYTLHYLYWCYRHTIWYHVQITYMSYWQIYSLLPKLSYVLMTITYYSLAHSLTFLVTTVDGLMKPVVSSLTDQLSICSKLLIQFGISNIVIQILPAGHKIIASIHVLPLNLENWFPLKGN